MNWWTLLGFVVGFALGGLGAVLTVSLCVVAADADARTYDVWRDEHTGDLS